MESDRNIVKTKEVIQVVIPMAGLGMRFRETGITVPKPLIPIEGKPMFTRAVDSVRDLGIESAFFVIIRAVDQKEHCLADIVSDYIPGSTLKQLESPTRGAIETVLQVASELDPNLPVLVLDCDIAFQSVSFAEFLKTGQYQDFDGALMYFPSDDPAYSYLATDQSELVTRIVEKEPISSKAVVGAYFFSTARKFITIGQQFMERYESTPVKEMFLSLVMDDLVGTGGKVLAIPAQFENFGTPVALHKYLQRNSQG